MKVVREKTCIKCKSKRKWSDFSPCWGKTVESSFLRRVCKSCEVSTPTTVDARALEREMDRLLKRRVVYEEKIDELNALLEERLQQVDTAKNGGGNEPGDTD